MYAGRTYTNITLLRSLLRTISLRIFVCAENKTKPGRIISLCHLCSLLHRHGERIPTSAYAGSTCTSVCVGLFFQIFYISRANMKKLGGKGNKSTQKDHVEEKDPHGDA
jgi:hypothetical protein